ncbi:MAG: hypothetical protein DYG92_05355 [Leptolyngbya sp. PLA1]|jgi:hypothetical protein|nr:hypothetical protein [Leptolyngbya sp. PLA1]
MNQSTPRSKSLFVGLAAGVGLTALAAVMMGQGASQPVKSEAQYFVTADGEGAHLWVREGTALRVVAHGECKECKAKGHDDHDHKEGDGHDHTKDAPKK